MRKKGDGKPCGERVKCAAPEDACGPGWGLCLSHKTAALDTLSFLKAMTPAVCASPAGAYVAAMSHAPLGVKTCPAVANRSLDNGCKTAGYGGEPLCCGKKCLVPSCSTALWDGHTRALIGAEGAGVCGSLEFKGKDDPSGVLCCKLPAAADDAQAGDAPVAAAAPASRRRYELTAAPSSLASSSAPHLDPVADSRAVLGESGSPELWWWSILSTAAVWCTQYHPVAWCQQNGFGPTNADGSAAIETTDVATSSDACAVTNGTAYGGAPIGEDRSATTAEACCAACSASAKCAHWNLNWGTRQGTRGCFFKAAGTVRHHQDGVASGSRSLSPLPPPPPEPSVTPLRLAELWPTPPASAQFWVQEWGSGACTNGSAAALVRWNSSTPLDVDSTVTHRGYPYTDRKYRFFRAAPVLASGWTILGELAKFVAVSPQRLALPQETNIAPAAGPPGMDAMRVPGSELAFDVIGAAGEKVELALVTPSDTVVWVDVELGSTGRSSVRCSDGGCVVGRG